MQFTEQENERFHASYMADPNSGCWLWTLSLGKKGYAYMNLRGGKQRAHRMSYANFVSHLVPGFDVHHKCNVRSCVNPSHLQLISHRGNILCSKNHVAERAAQTHCKRGHPLNGENLVMYKSGRQCRICILAGARRRHHETKANPAYAIARKRGVN